MPLSGDNGLAPEILCHGITTAAEKKKQLEAAGMIVADSIFDLKNELLKL